MNLEMGVGTALVVVTTILALAMLLPVRAPSPAPIDYEARRRRFDSAAQALTEKGFTTERMLVSHDGSVALFLGETCGRACILYPQPEQKISVSFRDLRSLASAEAVDLVKIAPDTGLVGRLRGDPLPGTRQMVGADLRIRFEATVDQPETMVRIHFAPENSSQARIATSVLRGKVERLRMTDAEAKARAKEDARSQATEVRRSRERKRAQEREADERRKMSWQNLHTDRV